MIKSLAVCSLVSLTLVMGACSHSKKKDQTTAKEAQTQATNAAEEAKKTAIQAATEGAINCVNKEDKRTIDLRKKDKGCELAYNKFGKEEIIATSAAGTAHCEKIADRIKTNLIDAGYKCE